MQSLKIELMVNNKLGANKVENGASQGDKLVVIGRIREKIGAKK